MTAIEASLGAIAATVNRWDSRFYNALQNWSPTRRLTPVREGDRYRLGETVLQAAVE